MACLIKAPDASGKGCVTFTTQERDRAICVNVDVRRSVQGLKDRFVIGLHHNWHDHAFAYDPLFDFSMAGDGDLVERDGRPVPRIPIDACNFAPPCFGSLPRRPFWDVLNVSRAVSFKGIPEFLAAIRVLYDRRRYVRVLHLCPVPPGEKDGTTLHDIRSTFEAMFTPHERQYFNLVTMEWDYPFPLDLETLAHFYRSSRVYVHAAPEERRCRTAAYAWADKMPVVARENVASILPAHLRREPFFFEFGKRPMADAILYAIECQRSDDSWHEVASEFSRSQSALRVARFLEELAGRSGDHMSAQPIIEDGLDLRLGRHHLEVPGANGMTHDLKTFCLQLLAVRDGTLAAAGQAKDPEQYVFDADQRGAGRIASWLKG